MITLRTEIGFLVTKCENKFTFLKIKFFITRMLLHFEYTSFSYFKLPWITNSNLRSAVINSIISFL